MKLILIAALFVVLTINIINASEAEDAWEEFKKTYNKNYGDSESISRKAIFLERYQKIADHNTRYLSGKETYKQKINKYADLTKEELRNVHPHGINLHQKTGKNK